MLEDLDRLDELVAKLRGGAGASLLSVPRSPGSAPAHPVTQPASNSEAEKKNDLGQVRLPVESPPAPALSAKATDPEVEAPPPAPETPPVIEWKPGCEQELHQAILDRLTDMTGTHLRRVSRTAISGPTQLDFFFPANYDLDRKLCDRPDVVNRLEKIVADLVGLSVRVHFKVSERVAEEPVKATPVSPASSAKSKFVELPEDPYLQDVMSVFGIKVWKASPQADQGGEA